MNKRFQPSLVMAVLAITALFVTMSGLHSTATTTTKAAATRPANPSVRLAALPASDIIIFVDTQRLLTDTLPNFMAGDPTLTARVNSKLDRFQKELGIDPRSFDSLAVGLRFGAAPQGSDFKFVAIANGRFNAASLIETGFEAARTKERIAREEQTYEGKKIFVLTRIRNHNQNTEPTAKSDAHKMAVAELDSSTIVMGDLESVRAALNPSLARVEQSLVDLATRTPNAFASFAGNLPEGAARSFGLRNGRADKMAASVRQIYGSVSTAGTGAETLLALRTESAEQARDIAQAINGLKFLGKLGIGGSRSRNKAEAEALSNLINGLSVTSQDVEVEIKLNVTQSDVAPLMRRF